MTDNDMIHTVAGQIATALGDDDARAIEEKIVHLQATASHALRYNLSPGGEVLSDLQRVIDMVNLQRDLLVEMPDNHEGRQTAFNERARAILLPDREEGTDKEQRLVEELTWLTEMAERQEVFDLRLVALGDEIPCHRSSIQGPAVVFTTPHTYVEYGGETYAFGKFYVAQYVQNGRLCVGAWAVPETRRAAGGYEHPHVSGTRICFGGSQYAVTNALGRLALTEVAQMTMVLLNSYGSGPYYSIENWSPYSTTCAECRERVLPNDPDAVDLPDGSRAHIGCTVQGPDNVVYLRSQFGECAACHTEQPLTPHVTAGVSMCPDCTSVYNERVDAIAAGHYVCPLCHTRYTGEGQPAAYDPYGEQIMVDEIEACGACCRIGDSTVSLVYPGVDVEFDLDGQVGRTDDSRAFVRPRVPFPERERCTCGAMVAVGSLSRTTWGAETTCPSCDPDGVGVPVHIATDPQIIQYWFDEFVRLMFPGFVGDCIDVPPVAAWAMTPDELQRVVTNTRRIVLGSLMGPTVGAPLRDLQAQWDRTLGMPGDGAEGGTHFFNFNNIQEELYNGQYRR